MASRKQTTKRAVKRGRKSAAKSSAARVKAASTTQPDRSAHALQDAAVEAALATGELSGPLEDYFGAANYAELRQLAREASTRAAVRGGPRVLILPGIMGSKIGTQGPLIFDHVFWVDPISIAAGKLADLALPGSRKFEPLGVILLAYLKLKLRLVAAGYNAEFYPFDWRQSVDDLGRGLKQRIEQTPGELSLVAHSMGGLVSRAAVAQGAKVKRLIMLGTPNFGSFAPVMAIRATYDVVRKVGWLDTKHTAEQLSRDVFGTFPGLVQMLPSPDHWDGLNLYDRATWPGDLAPHADILAAAPGVQKSLSPGRDNFYLIAGVEKSTAVSTRLETDNGVTQFVYDYSLEGDGTVPLAFAKLPGIAKTYYVVESHGSLPNNGTVEQAVLDLLEKDSTSVLPESWTPPQQRGAATRRESELRTEPFGGRRAGLLSQSEVRHLLDEVASPDAAETGEATGAATAAAPAAAPLTPGYQHAFDHVVVGRRTQHRIDLRFAQGSITEANTRAILLGVFSDVTPSGAARALDERLDGAITDLFRRRMFEARVGEVFVLPKGRHLLAADFVTFVGLGSFDRFGDQSLQTAAENVIRMLIAARIEEFATVLFGGGSGESPAGALQNLLTGFFRGLRDADHDQDFRRIVICEQDPARYIALKSELFRLSSTALCQDVEITFEEKPLPEPPILTATETRGVSRLDPVYLIVRQEQNVAGDTHIRSSLLTAGAKATIISGVLTNPASDLETLRRQIAEVDSTNFEKAGPQLAQAVLSEQIVQVLPRYRDHHLVVVHDAAMSRVPWEVMGLRSGDGDAGGVWFPALEKGLTHRYAADNLSVAKWLEERVQDDKLNILVVINPTEDPGLAAADIEGDRVAKLFAGRTDGVVQVLKGAAATHRALLAAFSSGRYDVIHYAGHAFFDPQNPERSGILAHREEPLTGAQLAGLNNLPTLVFFNACESARVRGVRGGPKLKFKAPASKQEHAERAVGFAEAFMRGGIANFLGTYWPVHDASAGDFAETFYGELVQGSTLSDALLAGRRRVHELTVNEGQKDWADYVFYGSPDFSLKQPPPAGG